MQDNVPAFRLRNAAALVLLILAAPRTFAGDVRTIEVEASEFSFRPAEIRVERDETVRLELVNAGQISHNLHLDGVDVKTETVQAGATDTIEFTASESGTIRFHCNVPGHEEAGMKGRLVVE